MYPNSLHWSPFAFDTVQSLLPRNLSRLQFQTLDIRERRRERGRPTCSKLLTVYAELRRGSESERRAEEIRDATWKRSKSSLPTG